MSELLKCFGVHLHLGDCLETMRGMADHSVDSIVTDPPYELGFMGKKWDSTGIAVSVELWREALRVLKPGGHLLAFSGTRTQHRMVCAIEDAGFEIRDQAGWMYGSGFPKSLDVSKAIDKVAGAERNFTPVGNAVARMIPGADQDATGSWIKDNGREYQPGVSEPATDAARQWQGWGTALKPAWEPICVARKPLIGTVAANVLAHGTGAINIDGCRVGTETITTNEKRPGDCVAGNAPADITGSHKWNGCDASQHVGRWPANILHDGSDEVLAAFPRAPGQQGDLSGHAKERQSPNGCFGKMAPARDHAARVESDKSASRFFYSPKASKSDRGTTNNHPTVKPTELMRYLCRLVTPPGGVVLDPFMGSGSTGKAAVQEGFQFIGCEMSPEYLAIATGRIMGVVM